MQCYIRVGAAAAIAASPCRWLQRCPQSKASTQSLSNFATKQTIGSPTAMYLDYLRLGQSVGIKPRSLPTVDLKFLRGFCNSREVSNPGGGSRRPRSTPRHPYLTLATLAAAGVSAKFHRLRVLRAKILNPEGSSSIQSNYVRLLAPDIGEYFNGRRIMSGNRSLRLGLAPDWYS